MKRVLIVIFFTIAYLNQFAQNLRINEFQAVNVDSINDEYGQSDDWIEIANFTDQPVNLNGYFLTDNKNNFRKCQLATRSNELILPAKGFIVLWADNEITQGSTHLNFKLSKESGFVGLLSPDDNVLDSISYAEQLPGCSIGRDNSNNSVWKYYSKPTPNASNSTKAYSGIATDPIFSLPSGVYSSPISLTISPKNGESIKFTLDKSIPTTGSLTYSFPLNLDKSTVVFSKATKEGWIDSWSKANVYLFNVNNALPILSVTIDTSYIFGTSGIYTHYDKEGPEWQKPCQLHFIENNTEVAQVNAGIAIQGHSSVFMPKKSFRVYFKEKFGDNSFKDTLFGKPNIREFKSLVLKSGYDDDITLSTGTLLRDPLSAEIWKNCGGLSTASNFKILYLNNVYWGIYNIRESINEDYIKSHTGMEDFDLIRYNYENIDLKYGSLENYNEMKHYLETMDLSIPANFEHASEILDIDYFINLMAFVQCTQYKGWTWGCSLFRGYYKDAKWRWTIWDTDRSYSDIAWNLFTSITNGQEEGFGKYILRALIKNKDFDRKLINRTCDLMNTTFLPENSIKVLDSLYTIIKPEMLNEFNRWTPDTNYWESSVEQLKVFLRNRPDTVRNQISKYFNLPLTYTIKLNTTGNGIIRINTLYVRSFSWEGKYFKDNKIEIEAIPAPGFRFLRWENIAGSSLLEVNLISDSIFTAVFEEDATNKPTVVINEICYKQVDKSGDWIELYNPTEFAINISNWILRDNNIQNKFVFPNFTVIPPKEYLVVVQKADNFASEYPGVVNYLGGFGDGDSGFGFGDKSESVIIFDNSGVLIDSVGYYAYSPWPVIPNDITRSIQLKDPSLDNLYPKNWVLSELAVTPGIENISSPLAINSKSSTLSISVYPNPAKNIVNIGITNDNNNLLSIEIYDLSGKIITSFNLNDLKKKAINSIIWPCSQYNGGLYILVVRTSEMVATKKIVVLK